MNFSTLFIQRPVATTLLTIGILLAGVVGFLTLPVSPLPQVDFPTISVQASLPGASPETMAATVAAPLEKYLGRIAGVSEMTSSSSLGSTRVTIQFDLSRNIDGAARDVQAALNAARTLLPTGLPSNPTYRKVNPADAPIMILALTSDTLTQGQMFDAADSILAQKLAQVEGIGQVTVGGGAAPAVRVELNPDALNQAGIGVEQVRTAITNANGRRPIGAIEDGGHRWQIGVNDQIRTDDEYSRIIVATHNGSVIRLSQLADVRDSVQDLRNAGSANGKPAVLVILFRQPGANIISTVDAVRSALPQLRASISPAIRLDVMQDRTPTIRASLREVERTLAMSVGLVILVVLLFLRDWRMALIPTVAVPVSLVGTFAIMHLCQFSLNTISLMALTVATGFVVDDAIVVLENITRHMEQDTAGRMTPLQAAGRGAREVGFTVVAMSLSLVAVFIPILLMGGIVGRLFREFAVTLSAAILVSLLVSLTTTPMMCAYLAGRRTPPSRGRFAGIGDRAFSSLRNRYAATLEWSLEHSLLMLIVFLATIALNVALYVIVAKGFFPQQDTGRLTGSIQADQSISFQAMRDKLADFVRIVQSDPAVENIVAFTGGGQRNAGQMFISLKPLAQRQVSADKVIARLRARLAHEPGASLYLQSVQDIRMGGRQSNAQYQFTLQADDLSLLRAWEPRIQQALTTLPELADVNTDQQDKGLQTSLVIDRDAAMRLGVSASLIDTTLSDLFSQRQVSTIYNPLNQYHVVMEAAPRYWQNPDTLKSVYLTVSNPDGSVSEAPLAGIAHYSTTYTPLAVNHQGVFPASTISFNLHAGTSLGQATAAIDRAMTRLGVPASIHGSFQGTARLFLDSLHNEPVLVLAALLAVYIVLGILYESTIHPLTILSTLPSAGVGALLALLLSDTEFSIIALIGVVLLIGIVKKNGIMLVDFALAAERERALAPREAIHEACMLRFRPIMMTTMAALFGAIPLALGSGDGAELRRPLGITIVGGLVVSQLLTLYTTPVVYLYMDRLQLWAARKWRSRPVPCAVGRSR